MNRKHIEKSDPMKHCQVDEIKICTRCGSINIKIEKDTIYCNECNAILCFEHKEVIREEFKAKYESQ